MPDWVSASSLAPSRDAAPSGPPATGDKAGQPDDVPEDPRQLTLSEIRLLQALAKRRKVLDARERELGQRQALLKAAEQQLMDRQAELVKTKRKPEQLLKVADKKYTDRINKLVKVYENMKPLDAAIIFNELEPAALLEVDERMKVRKAAPVIAAMNPDKARKLTRSLASRRNGAEKRDRQISNRLGK